MLIENQTRNTIIASSAISVKDFIGKSIGLISYPIPKPFVFKTQLGIHTFLMRYTIDVMLLDDTNRIIDIAPRLKPNRLLLWDFHTRTVIELPEGSISKSKSQIDDQLLFK